MRWVNRHMRRNDRLIAGAVPILILLLYLIMAAQRHAANPGGQDPAAARRMAQGMAALSRSRSAVGHFLFWTDTIASLERLGIGWALPR
jgi:NitT/TauT family transport system permease protein